MASEANAYPTQHQRMELPTGRAIVLLNVFVFVDGLPASLTLQYRTDVEAERHADRLADAAALGNLCKIS